ncbi:hypothetical protein [Streptomyces sp. WG5]|uniref:hypothetical protein n=1 Tax=Streptomyces sp. WG5 TaxID=3417648 RepID=UPI003CF8C067
MIKTSRAERPDRGVVSTVKGLLRDGAGLITALRVGPALAGPSVVIGGTPGQWGTGDSAPKPARSWWAGVRGRRPAGGPRPDVGKSW